ncbi:MAG: hypothetical protein K2V38_26370, partial [Gemmataceae bacterium]|nr:hypothetical protein [Gemmataceae bacterium]
MTACRRSRHWFVAAALVLTLIVGGRGLLRAADNPQGKVIADIQTAGNRKCTTQQILNIMHSRAGRPYDQSTMQEDVRRLQSTRWFIPESISVVTTNETDGRITVTVVVSELPSTIQDIVYRGAQHISGDTLRTLTGLRRGDAMNPYANETARAAILRKYQEDGRYYATVELAEGGKPTDSRVVFDIVEGPEVKVRDVEFVGNFGATSGRLKTQLVTKRQFVFGGRFNPHTLDADLKALTDYYHALGYLAVQIKHEVRHSPDMRHVTIAYHIVEGLQYQVAD